jgi:hypothetical protein
VNEQLHSVTALSPHTHCWDGPQRCVEFSGKQAMKGRSSSHNQSLDRLLRLLTVQNYQLPECLHPNGHLNSNITNYNAINKVIQHVFYDFKVVWLRMLSVLNMTLCYWVTKTNLPWNFKPMLEILYQTWPNSFPSIHGIKIHIRSYK